MSDLLPVSPLAHCTAAITAGGVSRRFGSDKAAALWREKPLLAHVAAALEGCPHRLLIAPPGKYAPPGTCALPGWEAVPDTRPGEGPLAGLEAALRATRERGGLGGWVAFTGVDLPALTPAYWAALAAARTPDALSVQALDGGGRAQPLGALYHTDLLARVTALLDAGERRLRLAAPEQGTVRVPGFSPALLRNVNTPDDLAALEGRAGEAGG